MSDNSFGDSYKPIRDYALIGDCNGSALVAKDGSIDWCALGRFDSDPVFCRILDANNGGSLQVSVDDLEDASRAYLDGTNILRTVFRTSSASVKVVDFMPVGRKPDSGVHDYVSLNAPFWLVRRIEGVEGEAGIRIRFRPSVEFAARTPELKECKDGLEVPDGPKLYAPGVHFSVDGDAVEGELTVKKGQTYFLVVAGHSKDIPPETNEETIEKMFRTTLAFWNEWIAYCRYDGPHKAMVRRSALTLKLLTYAPTGALVAAPTTSLPEIIGGERNWDYRYCWLRDSTLALYAMAAVGYSGEARRFGEFLQDVCRESQSHLKIMYGIGRERELAERDLDHLGGYRGSSPVRLGNGAHDQVQLDVYGAVLDWGDLYRKLGGKLSRAQKEFLISQAEFVAEHWSEAGQGLWEMRGEPRHHVFGKMMCWVALDRAEKLGGKRKDFTELRRRILKEIENRGIDPDEGYLRQAFDYPEVDAATLRAPVIGFPLDEKTLLATIERVRKELGRGDYLLRYSGEDGLEGEEGAFLICSFWLANALLMVGEHKEARELFERLLETANDVGLFAEEIHPESEEFLGNFPQGFSHLALIEAAVHLELLEKKGPEALKGTPAERARHIIEAVSGPRAIWSAFKKTGRIGRIFSSRESKLEWKRSEYDE